ncbi:hypothetical protein [Halorussus aquaticus]|uniref:Uncharacterized protein n=1 Tax=Halorussus aquaticus TaxID=2953748 RepID=A0ABD5Q393_9EURY|nr:hypothetical protein [Halorussus aquaticus]
MFGLPSHVRPSEWITALVLVAATGGVAVRASSVYSARLAAGIATFLLVIDVLLVWALLRNNSIRRQRALHPEPARKYRE